MRLRAWVDGGARGNPGPAGYGVLLKDDDGTTRLAVWGFLGRATNNVAEYSGLIAALERALELGATHLEVRTDSELIQRQVTGVYKVRQPHLRALLLRVRALVGRLDCFTILHVRREENAEADALVNRAIDAEQSGAEAGVAIP